MSVSFYIFITQNCRTFSSNSTADKANFSELEEGNSGAEFAVLCIKETNPVAVVADLNDGLIFSQVPHNCLPTRTGRGQDVLNLSVPGHNADVLGRLKERSNKGCQIKPGSSMGQTKTSYSNDHACALPCKHG